MTVDLTNPKLEAVLERADIQLPSQQILAQLDVAGDGVEGFSDDVLEVSRATWATDTRRADVLVVLMRKSLILVEQQKRGLFKSATPTPMTLRLDGYSDLGEIEVEELAGPTVMFLSPEESEHFMLSWSDPDERHRMFMAMFDAHRGNYARWGLQLDRASYVGDFDRYYAQIVEEGPSRAGDVYEWVQQQFGEFYLSNALGFAMDWRECELGDAERQGSSRRVGRIAFPAPWSEEGTEAQRIIVRLGEQLFDEGLLRPPYDERSFDTGEPISHGDAGPARLLALMTLAGYATTLEHPRATEWVAAARVGIPAVPSTVFSVGLRRLWAGIMDLPV